MCGDCFLMSEVPCEHYRRDLGLDLDENGVCVTCGWRHRSHYPMRREMIVRVVEGEQ